MDLGHQTTTQKGQNQQNCQQQLVHTNSHQQEPGLIDKGTQLLPKFTSSYGFYEPSTRFFYLLHAVDFAAQTTLFDPSLTTLNATINWGTNGTDFGPFSDDLKQLGRERIDLIQIEQNGQQNSKLLTFINSLPTSESKKTATRVMMLPQDLYPKNDEKTLQQIGENDETNDKPLPQFIYYSIYGTLSEHPKAYNNNIPFHTQLIVSSTTKQQTTEIFSKNDEKTSSLYSTSPLFIHEAMPISSMELDTTRAVSNIHHNNNNNAKND
jgi:hypothetical protein